LDAEGPEAIAVAIPFSFPSFKIWGRELKIGALFFMSGILCQHGIQLI
jgi:hypothetical protein